MKKPLRIALAGLVVASGLALTNSSPVRAWSAPGVCNNGSALPASELVVAVNGTPVTATKPYVFGTYTVVVCNDTNNHSYNVLVGAYSAGDNTSQRWTDSTELATTFSVTFTPVAGTTPIMAEGHGVISSFTIDKDKNTVTLVSKPIAYSDIFGNDCGNKGPADCVLEVKNTNGDRASADLVEFRVGVRYAETTGRGGEGLAQLPGMYWSSSAYYFWLNAACPTEGNTNSPALEVIVGGPHFKADGTINYGDVTVFIPATSVVSCFGAPPSVLATSLTLTRTVGNQTQTATTGTSADVGLQYTVTADDASGLTITIPKVTFSKPSYNVKTSSGKKLSRTQKTFTAVGSLGRVKKPSGGKLVVTSKTKKVCVAGISSVYGFKTGTCKVSVTSYDKSGKKVKSVTVTFRVS